MTRYIALLRAVNVGGTGKLPMAELKAMCAAAGFAHVETYIASGNVVFDSDAAPSSVKAELDSRLLAYADKPVGVLVRSAAAMQAVLAANPFRQAEPKFTNVIFLDEPPPPDALARVTGLRDEEMHLGQNEIYVHYPSGVGRSKLRIPAARTGTARNMNTVARLAEMASTS
ncbi:MAG: DUF1697 domain-containing protein [Alphaproteobacteria bacterium]